MKDWKSGFKKRNQKKWNETVTTKYIKMIFWYLSEEKISNENSGKN